MSFMVSQGFWTNLALIVKITIAVLGLSLIFIERHVRSIQKKAEEQVQAQSAQQVKDLELRVEAVRKFSQIARVTTQSLV